MGDGASIYTIKISNFVSLFREISLRTIGNNLSERWCLWTCTHRLDCIWTRTNKPTSHIPLETARTLLSQGNMQKPYFSHSCNLIQNLEILTINLGIQSFKILSFNLPPFFIGKNINFKTRETMKQGVSMSHAYHFTYQYVNSRQIVISSKSLKQDTQISFTHCLWLTGHHKTAI